MEDSIKKAILDIMLKRLTESNTTANFAIYATPYAFKKKEKEKEKVTESRYRDYKNDTSRSQQYKLNKSIIKINKALEELVVVLDNNLRLKEECGLKGAMWKLSPARIDKISKKLIYISNKIKELGQ